MNNQNQNIKQFTTTAGPRQTSDVQKALRKLLNAGNGTLERHNYGDMIVSTMGQDTPDEAAHRLTREAAFNAIHEKHAGTITAKNCREIIADCLAACPALEARRPVRDERTSEQEQAEQKARFAAAEQLRKLEQAEKDKKRAADREAVEKDYPFLERVKPGEYAAQTLAARNIRTELKRAFPGVKFSVTSESFSMGDSIDIKWQDGPTVKAVEAITNRYSKGSFDGMEDIYNYRTTAFTDTFGGSKYVHTHRQVTCFDTVKAAIMETFGPSFGEGWEKEQHGDRTARNELAETDLTGKGAFIRRDYDEETHKWTLVFEDLRPATVPVPVAPATITADGCRIEEHTHTKKGFQMWIVILSDRVGTEQFKELTERAKQGGGWYSRQWGKTPGGFAFKDKGAAETFAASLRGTDAPPPDGTDAPSRLYDVYSVRTDNGERTKLNARPMSHGEACVFKSKSNDYNHRRVELSEVFAPPVQAPRAPAPSDKPAKLRALADGLTDTIEAKRAPMTQNATPKRTLQYRARCLEADDLERAQTALYRLADGLEAGTLPDILKGYTSKAAVLAAVATVKDTSGGYYCISDTGRFRDSTAPAVALQALISGETPEQAERKQEQAIKNKILDLAGCKIPGFFVTPPAVAARVLEEADIQPGDKVLEPSAGTGNLADLARDAGGAVQCVEIRPTLCEILRLKGHKVIQGDFMANFIRYREVLDKVVMNPPFENGADGRHVFAAWTCLKEGGRLVAIMSEGIFFRQDKASQIFRDWLASEGGTSEKLPDGSFNRTGEITSTGTATRLVVIQK